MTTAAVWAASLSGELAWKPWLRLRLWRRQFSCLHQAVVHGIKRGLMLAVGGVWGARAGRATAPTVWTEDSEVRGERVVASGISLRMEKALGGRCRVEFHAEAGGVHCLAPPMGSDVLARVGVPDWGRASGVGGGSSFWSSFPCLAATILRVEVHGQECW
jgi:hypothetical protein